MCLQANSKAILVAELILFARAQLHCVESDSTDDEALQAARSLGRHGRGHGKGACWGLQITSQHP